MANYVLVYVNNPAGGEPTSTMDDWMGWIGGLGESLVDMGAPFAGSTAVAADGSSAASSTGLGGYSIVTADGLDAAAAIAKGCPILLDGGSVDVYETAAM